MSDEHGHEASFRGSAIITSQTVLILRLKRRGVPIAQTLVCVADLLDLSRKRMIYSWQSLRPIATVQRPQSRPDGRQGRSSSMGELAGNFVRRISGLGPASEDEDGPAEELPSAHDPLGLNSLGFDEAPRVLVGMQYSVPPTDMPVREASDTKVVFDR